MDTLFRHSTAQGTIRVRIRRPNVHTRLNLTHSVYCVHCFLLFTVYFLQSLLTTLECVFVKPTVLLLPTQSWRRPN